MLADVRREPAFSFWFAEQVQKVPTLLWVVVYALEFIVIYLQNGGV